MGDFLVKKKSKRLISLDAFRGITIASMILVNNAGNWSAVYPPLEHAKWHGWTLTDLIFPFFLFIVGVAIVFAFSKRIESGQSKKKLYLKILKRTLILFGLGLLLNAFPFFHLSTWRIPGVLQRIAITYAIASIIVLNTNIKWQAYIAASLLIIYWIIMKLVPVPGYGAGVLEPQGNLCGFIDGILLKGHTWMYAPAKGFDPEGLLSTIPAISSVLFGVLTGHWLKTKKSNLEKVVMLFVVGIAAIVLGEIMSIWFHINKNLWSSSYTVFTAGMALLFLGMCYWLIDIKGYKKWTTPFLVFGSNAITVYTISSLLARAMVYWWKIPQQDGSVISLKTFLYRTLFESWMSPINASLFYALTYVLIWFGLMAILYKKKIFIKI
ncbi:MAG: DUF5009 domain-containing protein [Candidatus Neomarinimicrobiota bacterium]|nr:MAG: DUF5009 domain-containing protein [Candidatus Neomarinimicrobiota bacterium]